MISHQLSRSPGLTPVMVACIKCHNGNEWEGTGDGRWEEECSPDFWLPTDRKCNPLPAALPLELDPPSPLICSYKQLSISSIWLTAFTPPHPELQ